MKSVGKFTKSFLPKIFLAFLVLLPVQGFSQTSFKTAQKESGALARKWTNLEGSSFLGVLLDWNTETKHAKIRRDDGEVLEIDYYKQLIPSDVIYIESLSPRLSLVDKLDLIVPKIEFSETSFEDAMESLRIKSKEIDPTGEGVNFVFTISSQEREKPISLGLRNVPLSIVIGYVTKQAGARYRVEEHAIAVHGSMRPTVTSTNSRPKPSRKKKPAPKDQIKPLDFYYSTIPLSKISGFIHTICFNNAGKERHLKPQKQMQVFFYDAKGTKADAFFEAVADINRLFGYQRIVPQLTAKSGLDEGQILIYFDEYHKARRALREINGGRASSFQGKWNAWYFWDANDEISKVAIVIASDRGTPDSLAYHLRESILSGLGFPGSAYSFRGSSFFAGFQHDVQEAMAKARTAGKPYEFFTERDSVIIQFCDRNFTTNMTHSDVDRIVSTKWPAYAREVDKKRVMASQESAFIKTLQRMKFEDPDGISMKIIKIERDYYLSSKNSKWKITAFDVVKKTFRYQPGIGEERMMMVANFATNAQVAYNHTVSRRDQKKFKVTFLTDTDPPLIRRAGDDPERMAQEKSDALTAPPQTRPDRRPDKKSLNKQIPISQFIRK